jgi:transcriptional regulator with XRE-family HTH domain
VSRPASTGALSARHTMIGSALRRYREIAGLTTGDAAAILGCDVSKVSRIETAMRGVRPEELSKLLAEYGADAEGGQALLTLAGARKAGGWWTDFQGLLSPGYVDAMVTESVATGIDGYAPLQLPELLHAPDYARAVAAADARLPARLQNLAVAATLSRQSAVLREGKAEILVIVGEAALRHGPGDPKVMRGQLRHLTDLASHHPDVTLQLLPAAAGPPLAGGFGGFPVLRFRQAPLPRLVAVDGPSGGLFLDGPASVTAYEEVLAALRSHALAPDDTARALRGMARG